MPRGQKSVYTAKQKRQARKIEKAYETHGVPEKVAAARAWATVNKLSGGGKLSGSGRKRRGSVAKKTARRTATRKPKRATR